MRELEIRLTDKCQLECKHCYAESGPYRNSQPIDANNLRTMAVKYRQMLEIIGVHENEPVVVSLTGGEPTIYGLDYVKRVIEAFREELSKISPYVHFGIVTNLLTFGKEFSDLIRKNSMGIFTSFDPDIRVVNGRHKEFIDMWRRKYMQAKDMGHEIPVSFTITRQLLSFDLDSFIREYGIYEIYLQPLQPVGRGKKNASFMGVTRKETADFIVSTMKNRPGGVKAVFPYDNVKYEYHKRHQTGVGSIDCWNDCYNSFSLKWDGTICTPGECVGSYGNILTDTVEQILGSKNRLKYVLMKTSHCAPECTDCQYIYFCRGGCISFKKVPSGGECHGMKSVLDYCIKFIASQSLMCQSVVEISV